MAKDPVCGMQVDEKKGDKLKHFANPSFFISNKFGVGKLIST